MTRPLILIVEDDEAIATGLAMNLRLEGFDSNLAADGDTALSMVGEHAPSLILLDIGLPRRDGLDVLATLRASGDSTPVIVLSAREGETDKVAALRLGADDYVTKPFALAELMARVAAVLRRANGAGVGSSEANAAIQRFGVVEVDPNKRTVHRDGDELKLTHLEFELLMYFLQHPREVIDRDRLLREVWQTSGSRRTVDNFVGQLRAKLEADGDTPRHIVTVRGSGYRFDP